MSLNAFLEKRKPRIAKYVVKTKMVNSVVSTASTNEILRIKE